MIAKKLLFPVVCGLFVAQLGFSKDDLDLKRIVDEGTNLSFSVDLKALAAGKLQIASKKFTQAEFAAARLFSKMDTFGLAKTVGKDDFILVTKSAFIFKASPLAFTSPRVTAPAYLEAAFSENDHNQRVDNRLVYTEKKHYGWVTIKAKVHFGHCIFDTTPESEVQEMGGSCAEFERVANLVPYDELKPSLASYSYVLRDDLSADLGTGGSNGFTTYNFYYDIGNGSTLHLSYKIVTFKNEDWYHSWKYKLIGIWGKLQGSCEQNQREGTLRSLSNIFKFLNSAA